MSSTSLLKLAFWEFSLNLLHGFTLCAIDIHQNMPTSLLKTPVDHFHFHLTYGLDPDLILTVCLKRFTLQQKSYVGHNPTTRMHQATELVLTKTRFLGLLRLSKINFCFVFFYLFGGYFWRYLGNKKCCPRCAGVKMFDLFRIFFLDLLYPISCNIAGMKRATRFIYWITRPERPKDAKDEWLPPTRGPAAPSRLRSQIIYQKEVLIAQNLFYM